MYNDDGIDTVCSIIGACDWNVIEPHCDFSINKFLQVIKNAGLYAMPGLRFDPVPL